MNITTLSEGIEMVPVVFCHEDLNWIFRNHKKLYENTNIDIIISIVHSKLYWKDLIEE